jgi:two-component system response regulator FixJ
MASKLALDAVRNMNPETPLRRNQHIYIVDDDAAVTRALARGLGQLGFDVHQFQSARNFLERAVIFRPAMLVIDMQMPECNGVELQAMLKTKGWHLPVIFISGESTVIQGITAMKQGALDFLVKPFDFDRLCELIDRAIELDTRHIQAQALQQACQRLLDRLKPRELEAYRCLAQGQSYREMMLALDISLPTAKQYRTAVMRKMGFATLAMLLQFDKDLHLSESLTKSSH